MNRTQLLALLLGGMVLLSGCAVPQIQGETVATAAPSATNPTVAATVVDLSALFSDRDKEIGYDEASAVRIALEGTTASCDSSAVTIDGGTITIGDEGTYVLTGALDDGMVIINAGAEDKVQLVLDNAQITCADSAAIYIPSADKVFVTTAANTTNTLANGGSYVAIDESNIDGVIFSKCDLTLNGAGTLRITADTEHGVVTKDDLVVTSGSYSIAVAGHGLSGKDSVAILDGTFHLQTGKDGIHSENQDDTDKGYVYLAGGTYAISAGGDGFSASGWMQVDGGSCIVTTGGGQRRGDPTDAATDTESTDDTTSTKGFKAGSPLTITGGSFQLDCADDAFHTNGSLTYAGATAQVRTGDDAFHADGSLTVVDGTIDIRASYEGLEGQSVTIYGGTIDIVSSDDGVNAAGATPSDICIAIAGGTLTVDAGGDGLDSNGDVVMSGGTVCVSASQQGGEAPLDYDGNASITGGTFLGVGMSGMMQNFGDDSTQGSLLLDVSAQSAGSTLSIRDAAGTVLATWDAPKGYSSVVISCPALQAGATYTVSAGTEETEVTLVSLIYGDTAQGGRGQRK